MVTCQSSELGWEVTVELATDFLSLGWGSVTSCLVSPDTRRLEKREILTVSESDEIRLDN